MFSMCRCRAGPAPVQLKAETQEYRQRLTINMICTTTGEAILWETVKELQCHRSYARLRKPDG